MDAETWAHRRGIKKKGNMGELRQIGLKRIVDRLVHVKGKTKQSVLAFTTAYARSMLIRVTEDTTISLCSTDWLKWWDSSFGAG